MKANEIECAHADIVAAMRDSLNVLHIALSSASHQERFALCNPMKNLKCFARSTFLSVRV